MNPRIGRSSVCALWIMVHTCIKQFQDALEHLASAINKWLIDRRK